jgi:hypothetical protein
MSVQLRFTAFILAHGIISPDRQPAPSTDPKIIHYNIHGQLLPPNTRLYSPKILGNAYYDRQGTDNFISGVFGEYYSIDNKDGIRPNLDSFCLQKIVDYEREHTDSMKHSLDVMDRESAPLFQSGLVPFTETQKNWRKQFIEGITHKTNTEWCEHTWFIQQKKYQINRDNCILLFCNNTNTNTNPQRRDTSFLFPYRNNNVDVVIHPNYYQIKIKFTRTVMYTFEQMNELLNSIINEVMTRSQDSSKQHDLRDWRAERENSKGKSDNDGHGTRSPRSRTPEPMVAHEIVFYDFTCCTIRFPLDKELYGLNVNLLSARIPPTPKLVYGTTRTEVVDDEKKLQSMLSFTGTGGILTVDDSDVEEITLAGSASPVHSNSVSVKSTIYLFVNVDHMLHTFISTINVVEASLSVSPGKGGHRVSNRNRNRNRNRNKTRNLKSGTRKQKRRYNISSSRRTHRLTRRRRVKSIT